LNTQITQYPEALIIDDEEDICYLLGSLLRKRDVKSKHVNTLKDAANMLEVNDPHIIFLDNHLPDGMGVNFIGFIKRFHPAAKIVMITAFDTTSDKQKAFKEGVDYFMGKPFSKEKVNDIMEDLGH
jgi:two-component system, OmpR family, response regulator